MSMREKKIYEEKRRGKKIEHTPNTPNGNDKHEKWFSAYESIEIIITIETRISGIF